MKATLISSVMLVLATSAARAANPGLPLIANNVTVDGIVVGADIGGTGTVPPSCPTSGPDLGWRGVLGQNIPLAAGNPGTQSATLFLAGHKGGTNLDKIYVGVHVENAPDFTVNDKLTIYFQADATKGNWDATNDFALVLDGIGPSAGTPGDDGCSKPGGQVRYYLNVNNAWVPQAAVPPGITFATSYDYEQVHDAEHELWELEIGIDVSALNIPATGKIGIGCKLYLFEAGISATTAYHYPATLTPVPDSGVDFNPNSGGVTPGTLQPVAVGAGTFDVIISSIKGTSNGGAVGQFTQLTSADFDQAGNALKHNHFTADVKFVNPANLGDMSPLPIPNSGNVIFHIMPWSGGGFTGNFIMATIPQSFTALGQTQTIPVFDWPRTKADWDATGGKLNATAPGSHPCLEVDVAGFNVDLPNGNVMQQNLAYTSLSTIQESFLVGEPKETRGATPGADGRIEYILRARWDNLAPKFLTGSQAFRFRFTNASAIGLCSLGGDYYAMRLKPGEQKRVLLEISGGVMPNPAAQYKLPAQAGGTLLKPASGVPPLEIPVKEGSIVSIVSLGLISLDPNNKQHPQNDPNGYSDPGQIEHPPVLTAIPVERHVGDKESDRGAAERSPYLLRPGVYRPEDHIGAVIASFDGFRTSFVVGTDATFAIAKNCKDLSLAINNLAGRYGLASGEFELNVVVSPPLTLPTRLTARGSAANEKDGVPAKLQPGSNLPQLVVDVGQRDRKQLIPQGYVAYAVYASHPDKPVPTAPATRRILFRRRF